MNLQLIDWAIIIVVVLLNVLIGILVKNKAFKKSNEYFLSDRNMPWWLLGVSMVATTFSADTPNLVTDIVRKSGISGNWVWWCFVLTGMLTVFVYARLWRRSGVVTDLGFYALRYAGKEATLLRYFRAIYLGVFFNVFIMATVLLAGIKIGNIMLGLSAYETLLFVGLTTLLYSTISGFKGVVYTDFIQFIIAMTGTIWASIYIINLPEVGGLSNLISHPNVVSKLDFIPSIDDWDNFIIIFLIPIAVQWWSVWYPGSEPGGGGYLAQRILAAKNEKNGLLAVYFFTICHYIIRPWPWILVALASLIMFPQISDIKSIFPHADESLIADDMAYPAMLNYLPIGLIGLVISSLIAALMSTISTHLNWGSSYVVHDFYAQINKNASEPNKIVISRITTICLLILSGILALNFNNAKQAFDIILSIGTGTGLIFILRWFWWRINAYTEIAGMFFSFVMAIYLNMIHPIFFDPLATHEILLTNLVFTTICWITVTFLTPPVEEDKLKSFFLQIQPGKLGWGRVIKNTKISPQEIKSFGLGKKVLSMMVGVFMVYFLLFGVGYLLFSEFLKGYIFLFLGIVSFCIIFRWLRKSIV